jgi:CMP-N-acetylneuraminic acid synthetase
MDTKKIVVVIPARSGSKGIIDKNVSDFKGKPLIFWTINQALRLKNIDKIIVSTNSQEYGDIIRSNEPFNKVDIVYRPDEISQDNSLDIECFQDVLNTFSMMNYKPDIFIHLRPTYPTRKIEDINKALKMFLNSNADSLRSVTKNNKSVYKSYFLGEDGYLKRCIDNINIEFNNYPRQLLPNDFLHNGCIDIVKAETVLNGSMSGKKILPYLMEEIKDIDTIEDLENISIEFDKIPKFQTFCFDIDGVICTNNINYENAIEIKSTVDLINKLYENDNKIIILTARGSITNIDWLDLTQKQLTEWGVKYHELRFGKPAADYYIDDKFINLNKLKKEIEKND